MWCIFALLEKRRSNCVFKYESQVLKAVGSYRYFSAYFGVFLNYREGGGILADAGGCALSSIIAKFKTFGTVNCNTHKGFFETGVVPVIEYCSGI